MVPSAYRVHAAERTTHALERADRAWARTLRAIPPLVAAVERAARALGPVIRPLERFNGSVERRFRARKRVIRPLERPVRSTRPRTHAKPSLTAAYGVSRGKTGFAALPFPACSRPHRDYHGRHSREVPCPTTSAAAMPN